MTDDRPRCDDNASIARRIREMPECAHDPILYEAAASIERGNGPLRVLLGALRAYASDAVRLRAVAAETIAKYGAPVAFYDPAERATEKQRSRDADARRLAAGDVTRKELARENSPFAGLVGAVDFTRTGLPK